MAEWEQDWADASERPTAGNRATPDGWQPLAQPGDQVHEVVVRESPARMIWQIVLAVLGVGAFVALVLVWLNGTGIVSDNVALLVLVGALTIILLAEVLLLRPVYNALFGGVPASLAVTPDEDNFIVGCPGCGTVFTVTQKELDSGKFGCHNCGRPGFVKDHNLNRSTIRNEVCRTCGNKYLEYAEHSECPVCHTFNEY